jgi:hypothetical protein
LLKIPKRFNFRAKIGNYTVFAMLSETQTLEGITSLLPDKRHIILWDIEKCTLEQVKKTLRKVQFQYNLSDIFITSDYDNSFHGYCFSKVTFKTFLKILLDTEYLDYNFFYWTVSRSKATMRTSSKQGREQQKLVSVLESYRASIPDDKMQQVIYDTGIEKVGICMLLGGDKNAR